MKTTLVAIIVALVAAVSASAAATPRPISCFKAHGWIVKGTNHKGTAWPRPKIKHAWGYNYAQWQFYSPGQLEFAMDIGLSRKQRLVARVCTGDHHL